MAPRKQLAKRRPVQHHMVAYPHMGAVGTCVIRGEAGGARVLQVGSLAIRKGWRANTFCTAIDKALEHIPLPGPWVVAKLIVVRPNDLADPLTHQVAGACWGKMDSMRMETDMIEADQADQADPVAKVTSWLQRNGHDTFVPAATKCKAASLALLTALRKVGADDEEDEEDKEDEDKDEDEDEDEDEDRDVDEDEEVRGMKRKRRV